MAPIVWFIWFLYMYIYIYIKGVAEKKPAGPAQVAAIIFLTLKLAQRIQQATGGMVNGLQTAVTWRHFSCGLFVFSDSIWACVNFHHFGIRIQAN